MPLGVMFGPVIGYNDMLYMGEEAWYNDTVNYFYAVDKNGNNAWTYRTPGYAPSATGPILLRDSSIYFFSFNDHLYALNKNGVKKWAVSNISVGHISQAPLDKNANLYVSLWDTLMVISPGGFVLKRITFPQIIGYLSFSTGGDTIFALTGRTFDSRLPGYLTALDLNGNVLWNYSFPYHNGGIPLVDNQNRIYVLGADSAQKSFLFCVNPNGTLVWKFPIDYAESGTSPSMDRNGNIIFFDSRWHNNNSVGTIVKVDYTGHEKWETELPGDYIKNLASVGLTCDAEGKVYGGGTWPGGNFYCLDSNGVILWTYTPGVLEYDSCPAIGSDGTLYIGYHSGANCTQNLVAVNDSVTSVTDVKETVNGYQLSQNYPNPFNPVTKINYQIPKAGLVSIKIFDILGKEAVTLVNDYKGRGKYQVSFDGSGFSSGIYFCIMRVNDFVSGKKMLLIK
jgi:sugar lactone lactonase YvrE